MQPNTSIPDFSQDDFANDKFILKQRAAAAAYDKMVKESLSILKDSLGVQDASHKNLKSFSMFRDLQPTIVESLRSVDAEIPMHVVLIEYATNHSIGRLHNSGSDHYLFGHFPLNKTYPKTFICKETVREKIVDLFVKVDLDFKHSKKFSRKFQVLTEDKVLLSNLLQFKQLDDLAAFPDMEVEIQQNACLFRTSRRAISIQEATSLVELTKCLVKIFR
jgi:hypothetical protein